MSTFVKSIRRQTVASRLPAVAGAVIAAGVGGLLLVSPRFRSALQDLGARLLGQSRSARALAADRAESPRRGGNSGARQHQEELLDEGIEESFPASDPVSVKRIT